MVSSKFEVIWTAQAINSLKLIHHYYVEKSPVGAQTLIKELLEAPKKVHFAKQYQLDEILPNYRRIIIRDYKIIYDYKGKTLVVLDIISSKRSPDRNK